MEHGEPGGVSCTTRQSSPAGEIGVQPPPQALVEALGAIDVGHRNDDDLELRVDHLDSRKLGRRFSAHPGGAHRALRGYLPVRDTIGLGDHAGKAARAFQPPPTAPCGPRREFAAMCVSPARALLQDGAVAAKLRRCLPFWGPWGAALATLLLPLAPQVRAASPLGGKIVSARRIIDVDSGQSSPLRMIQQGLDIRSALSLPTAARSPSFASGRSGPMASKGRRRSSG